jgi:RimJ/RimL family protein N-acetyltransferase
MKQPIEFDTLRLAFRVRRDEHREPFAALNADPEVMRHFPAPLTRAESDAVIDRALGQFAEQGFSCWAVERRDTGDLLGCIGIWWPRWTLPIPDTVEVGWWLARSAWGQGYATEGARASLRVGFEQLGLLEIIACTSLRNQPSLAVMRRLGMRDTGRDFDHPGMPEGHPVQRHALYRITSAEFSASSR